jgi:hypothetical protein
VDLEKIGYGGRENVESFAGKFRSFAGEMRSRTVEFFRWVSKTASP